MQRGTQTATWICDSCLIALPGYSASPSSNTPNTQSYAGSPCFSRNLCKTLMTAQSSILFLPLFTGSGRLSWRHNCLNSSKASRISVLPLCSCKFRQFCGRIIALMTPGGGQRTDASLLFSPKPRPFGIKNPKINTRPQPVVAIFRGAEYVSVLNNTVGYLTGSAMVTDQFQRFLGLIFHGVTKPAIGSWVLRERIICRAELTGRFRRRSRILAEKPARPWGLPSLSEWRHWQSSANSAELGLARQFGVTFLAVLVFLLLERLA